MSDLVNRLVKATGLNEYDVRDLIMTAPRRYKSYPIAKRDGTFRIISQPAREIKVLQRALCHGLLNYLPVHDAATAYVKGRGIWDNAKMHARSGPILKMDLRNFFPSIRAKDWVSYCKESRIFESEEDFNLSALLLFRRSKENGNLVLSIGAPSSPVVSNLLMYQFDDTLVKRIDDKRVIYTRYADDLTFSAPRTGFLKDVKANVARTIRQLRFPKLDLNDGKTVLATKKYHRGVTGLTLTNDGRVSLGHARKRTIHAGVHAASLGKLDARGMQSLSGMLAFTNAVEPAFLEVLRRRYGANTIAMLQRFVLAIKAE